MITVTLLAILNFPLGHGTKTWDWNVGLDRAFFNAPIGLIGTTAVGYCPCTCCETPTWELRTC